MKKSNALKYIICTFAFVLSFFMLFNSKVKAANVEYNIKNNMFLTLTEDGEDYVITGGYHTCGTDSECLETIRGDLVIPGSYNGKSIVRIEGAADLSSVGVLDGLKDVVVGTVTISENIETIGLRAFYRFSNLKEVKLANSVTLIENFAFDMSGVEKIHISRMESSYPFVTSIESSNTFSGMGYLTKVIFPNYTIADYYKSVEGYNSLESTLLSKFTFAVTYIYHEDQASCDETVCTSKVYYYGDNIEILDAPEKTGFNFMGWYPENGTYEIVDGSRVNTINSTYPVVAKWELKKPSLVIKSYYEGQEVDGTVTYAGKNKFLEIKVDVVHELGSGYAVSYTWYDEGWKLNETSNTYKISSVKESSTYTCEVKITYGTSYVATETISLNATILKREIQINVNDNVTEYGTYVGAKLINNSYFVLNQNTPLAEGEIIKSVNAPLYTDNNKDLIVKPDGEAYENVLVIEDIVIGYEDDETNYLENYDIDFDYGDLTILKKNIEISLDENIVVTYGENVSQALLLDYEDKNVYGEAKVLQITYSVDNDGNLNVGQYDILGMTINNTNYVATFSGNSVGKLVIEPREVDVVWNIDEELVYDGEEKLSSAYYSDINGTKHDLGINILKNNEASKLVNAGEYVLTVYMITYNVNYELINNVNYIEIEKADSILNGITSQTKLYNGMSQGVDVTLNHNETTVKGTTNSSCRNAHSVTQSPCSFTVYADETENYKSVSKVFYLRIQPIVLDIEPKLFEITYGTAIGLDNLSMVYTSEIGEEVLVFFSKQGSSSSLDVGYYDIANAYVSGTNNYEVRMVPGSGVNKIKIIPYEVEIRFYFYENLVYDGKVKNIEIHPIGTSEDIGLEVDYNGKTLIKNAGKYRIDLSLTNDNYVISGKSYLEFEIAKANYDVSGLSLKDKKVKYNFKSHSVVLDGELPSGLTANYTIDGEMGNGTYLPFGHTVKVTFEGDFENYNVVEPLEATLYIDMTWVFVSCGIVIVFLALCITAFILLVKYEIIKLTDKEQRRRLRRVIRKNKAILAINEMFKENQKLLKKEEEEIVIEEDVSFVKNVVEVKGGTSITLSFVDKLFKSELSTKEYYSEVKNELLSYEGIVSKIKRDYETFYVNNIPVAKFDVVDGILQVYLALDPTQYKAEEYKHTNVSKQKDFVAVPLKLTVKNIESLRHAKMFVRIIRKREKLKFASNFIRVDYVSVYTAKDNSIRLFKKRRVKKGSKESLED